MEIIKVLGITITVLALLLALRGQGRAEMALMCSMAFSVMMLIWILAQMEPLLNSVQEMMQRAAVGQETVALLVKVTGVALISEFAAQICRDSGEGALAGKAELAGKVAVLSMALPLIVTLCSMALSLLPESAG